jgi:AcrR family transcriptional regulator
MGMSIPYEETGRTRQKARTRAALVGSTRELLSEGVTPTVEQAADRAAVSRTTAYRYFPNQRALLHAVFPEVETSSLLDGDETDDPVARLETAIGRLTDRVIEHEPELRAQLRLSLEPGDHGPLPFRQGRGIRWIEDALAPLRGRVPAAEIRRLVLAIRAGTGIEALVWLTDIAGLSRDEALGIMRWSARAQLESVLAQSPASAGPASRRESRRGSR